MLVKNKYSDFIDIINKNIIEINNFFINNIQYCDKIGNINNKLKINCPFCGDNRKKLSIFLEKGNFKCFKCGESGSLIKLVKKLDLYDEFTSLLTFLSSMSNFDIQTLFRTSSMKISEESVEDEIDKKIKTFIKEKFLLDIYKLPIAKKYAMERVFYNKEELNNYKADDRYIYIPIVVDYKIVAYLGRKYINLDYIPRYIIHTFDENVPLIGFIDEVSSNLSVNNLYIAEGYFDSFAINYAMTNYVSICLFGKSKKSDISKLGKYFPFNTNIYLTLDSESKDFEIVKDILKMGDELSRYFSNIYVIILETGDPADILKQNGSLALRKILKENTVPFIKYKILYKGARKYGK